MYKHEYEKTKCKKLQDGIQNGSRSKTQIWSKADEGRRRSGGTYDREVRKVGVAGGEYEQSHLSFIYTIKNHNRERHLEHISLNSIYRVFTFTQQQT